MVVSDSGNLMEESFVKCAVPGSADIWTSVRCLAQLLKEPDEHVWRKQFAGLGIACDSAFIAAVRGSADLCRRGLRLHPRRGELAISFNGGKDACVVLYLWLAAALAENAELVQHTAMYFDSSDEFDSVRDFVSGVVKSLGLNMVTVAEISFRQGMVDLTAGGLRAVVMGQRRGDPWMNDVDAFSPSTDGWPAFMRVNPIIDWSYGDVWTFLRGFRLPYCKLYDEGYTSLGSIKNTLRNPSLQLPNGSYAPAYTLGDDSLERAGRMPRQTSAAKDDDQLTQSRDVDLVATTKIVPLRSLSGRSGIKSAGIVVIGSEILNGKVRDGNAHFLCGELHRLGVSVSRIEVVPDDIDTIACIVRTLSSDCDFVFTSGGVGPTHDDVSMAGVASAFGSKLVIDERLLAVLVARGSAKSSLAACRKMASVPEGSMVEWPEDGNPWPIVCMGNVYIFAGMPSVCRLMFERAAKDGRFAGERQWICATIRLDAEEADILEPLQHTVDTFPDVDIGSYPHAVTADNAPHDVEKIIPDARTCRLTITFEAFDEDMLTQARMHLSRALPADVIVDSAN